MVVSQRTVRFLWNQFSEKWVRIGGVKKLAKGIMGRAGGVGSMRDIASIGKCAELGDSDQVKQCTSCQDALLRQQSATDWRRTICDRVTCPSAPTIQTYIRAQQSRKLVKVTTPGAGTGGSAGGTYYAGSSCSFGAGTNPVGITGVDGRTPISPISSSKTILDPSFETVSALRAEAKTQQGTSAKTPAVGSAAVDNSCYGLHPADPKCCGVEYSERYDSACSFSGKTVDFFNELDQSVCLGAQNAGKLEELGILVAQLQFLTSVVLVRTLRMDYVLRCKVASNF